jgi:hypothetical protein
MTAEQVVTFLERFGGTRGLTASPGSADFARATQLNFHLCECSAIAGPGVDFIARGSRGGILYIGVNGDGEISCGPKGFHHYPKASEPCLA